MKRDVMFSMVMAMLAGPFISLQVKAQMPINISYAAPSCSNAVFSENFDQNELVNSGSDLYHGLPRNGSWQIVSSVDQLGGGGYLPVSAPGDGNFLAAHTSNTNTDRVWFSQMPVYSGVTYNFCASVALIKNLGKGAVYLLGIYANGKQIGIGRVNFEWGQICGSYTVPQDVSTVEFSIRDPKKGLFFVGISNICISTARPMADRGVNPVVETQKQFSVFPNPSSGNAVVRFTSMTNQVATVRVFDNNGKIVLEQKRRIEAGTTTIALNDLQKAPSGTYLVQVIAGDKVQNQKLVLSR